MIGLIALLAVTALLGVGVVLIYNSLVGLRVRVDNAWSDIDVQLKRRHDLIPNLVEVVKGYAAHERGTLEEVLEARARARSAAGPAERGRAEGAVTNALGSLFAVTEAYPQLQAERGFRELHSALVNVEDSIQNARRYYNAVVRDHNTRVQTVPSNLVAGAFGFGAREFFAAAEPERAAAQLRL